MDFYIAEAEMRRVNELAGLLTDPEERLRYDRCGAQKFRPA